MPGMPVLATHRRPYAPSPDTLRLALRAARVGIWEWHLDTNHCDWSAEIWDLYGLPRSVPPSFDAWLAGIHPDDQAKTCEALIQASQLRQPFEVEWRTHPLGGPQRWLQARGEPVAGHKSPTRYVGMVVDITDRKRAEQSVQDLNTNLERHVVERTQAVREHERLLQTILDGMPGMVGYWTQAQRNQFANQAYSDWIGKAPAALRHCHLREALGEEAYQSNLPHIEGALRGEAQRFERSFPVPGQPGKCRLGEVHYLPDVDGGEVRGFLVLVFDTTEARKAELAAEAASEAKSEFLAAISHEVRTPLNAMFGLAQLGARQGAGLATQRTFEQILDAAQHLLALVNDMLDFSKIEAGQLTLPPARVNLAQVLEHVLSLKSVRAHAKGLQLRVLEGAQVPQYCEGDSTRLSQILLNLLSNAIRYTDHGEIVLRLDVQDHHLCCEVTDTGIGMGPEQIDKLFKPFSQVHTRPASQVEGFGLGLAITQRLVRLMNGDIQVHSSPGAGSQFSVRLPLNAAEPADLRHLRTVALVGLEADERECLQSELSQRGCEVHDAQTAPEPPQPMPQVIVLGPVAARMTDAQQMCQWVDAGVTVLLSGPPGATPDLPPRLHDDAFLAGPLSALRLANAVERQLRTPAPNASGRLLDLRVLAAEDNPVNRMVLGQMLEQEGAHVTFATDGEEAVAAVREQGAAAFDLMLCDIQMPIMDGYEATRLIHDLAPHLPVVGLTAHAFASAKRQAREAGMVDYVTKPYLLDTLVDVVRRHVGAPRPTALPCPVNSSPPSSPVSPFSPFPKAASANAAHLTPVNTTTAPTLCTSDFQQMQKHFSSQPLLLERLVGMLSRTLNELDAELGAALSARNFTTLSKVAHNIKGTALNLHAPELTRLAMQTQDEARQTQDQAWQSGHALQASLRQFLSEAAQ